MGTSYIPSTKEQQLELLNFMNLNSMDDLLTAIPRNLRVQGGLKLPDSKSELEVVRIMEALADENIVFKTIFRGAGAYRHFIPAVVRHICSREEFVTAYTPYQAEMSQGVLASIFEYQTMICRLTNMDVSNASVYDGASAAAEAVMMCIERSRNTVLLSAGLAPNTIRTIKTYCAPHGIAVKEIPLRNGVTDTHALISQCEDDTACFLFAQPNYLGNIEDGVTLSDIVKNGGAKLISYVNPISLALLKTPGEYRSDIAVGDAQPCGLPLSFGGPYLGFMACTKAMARKLPGRIVGETTDRDGKRAFVLTLQAREQHIRREKASSSICSNQALCAMTVNVYLSSMGPQGLKETALLCYDKSHYAAQKFSAVNGISLTYNSPFFDEFVTTNDTSSESICAALEESGMLAGLPLDERHILWCFTEMNTKDEIDKAAEILEAIGSQSVGKETNS